MTDFTDDDVKQLLSLAARFEQSQRVRRFVSSDPKASAKEVATEAADGLMDICSSAALIRTDLLPRLFSEQPENDEFDETLGEIAEELRHIYYHLRHMRLFNYILPIK